MQKLLKRRWLLATVLLAAVIGVAYLLVPVSEDPISQATCDKVQLGWKPKQVQEVLGEPTSVRISYDGLTEEWRNKDNAKIAVRYDLQTPLVKEKRYTPSNLSVFERLKRRMERRLRALWPSAVPVIGPS
jgi:hypothetical protein